MTEENSEGKAVAAKLIPAPPKLCPIPTIRLPDSVLLLSAS